MQPPDRPGSSPDMTRVSSGSRTRRASVCALVWPAEYLQGAASLQSTPLGSTIRRSQALYPIIDPGIPIEVQESLKAFAEGKAKEPLSDTCLFIKQVQEQLHQMTLSSLLMDIAYAHPWFVAPKVFVNSLIYYCSLPKVDADVKIELSKLIQQVIYLYPTELEKINLELKLAGLSHSFERSSSRDLQKISTRVAFLWESERVGQVLKERADTFQAYPSLVELKLATQHSASQEVVPFQKIEEEALNQNFSAAVLVAKELVNLSGDLYHSVPLANLFSKNRPELDLASESFNEICQFVLKRILMQEKPKHRERMFAFFCEIAKHLLDSRDFATLLPVLNALNHTAIERLDLKKPDGFSNLNKLIALDGNQAFLRSKIDEALTTSTTPVSLILKDLEMFKEGRFLPDNSLNFNTLKGIALAVWRFHNSQKIAPKEPKYTTDISRRIKTAAFPDTEAYVRSYVIKPKK